MTTNFIVGGEGDLDNNRYLYSYEEYLIDDAVNTAGRLWSWGNNSDGEMGDGTQTSKSSPVQTVSAGTDWKQVSAGGGHMAAVKTDGTLWLWGYNIYGALGDNTVTGSSSPVQTVSAGTNWKQVSAGGDTYSGFTAAIKTDGSLWLWGKNDFGSLGDNTTTARSSPVQTVSGGSNWKQVSAGLSHTAAIKTDGTLWLWGLGSSGQLGDNTTVSKSSPVQTVSAGTNWKQVSAGGTITAAVKTDGTLWLWGDNNHGQLGDNTTTARSSPVQTVSAGTNWASVSSNRHNYYGHAGAIKTDGTLWMWGYNQSGQLGDNTSGYSERKSSPVQTVSAGTNWKQISCGGSYDGHTAAIKTDGTLWLWGANYYGQLGDGENIAKSSPVQTVASNINWRQVSCSSGREFTGAVTY